MKRMEEDWLVKRIVGSNVRGVRLRGRQQTGWMKSVKRGMSVKKGWMIVRDTCEWRAMVN